MIHNIRTKSPAETKRIGKKLAQSLKRGCVIALEGNLGAGKTVLTKGIAAGLGVTQVIQSPTFVLMKVYSVQRPGISHLVHVDCYRVNASQELRAIGLEDYLNDDTAVVVIEWADKILDLLPHKKISLRLAATSDKERSVLIDDAGVFSTRSIRQKARGSRK